MVPFVAACLAIIVLSLGTAFVLDTFVQVPVAVAFSTSGVRR